MQNTDQPTPTVSVIIPCYNHGIYIEETIQSVISSNYNSYEIIIVNDGSTDSYTNELLEKMSIDKVIILQTSNQGLAAARNVGIVNSHGKYILPLDADDKISPDYLEEAVKIMEQSFNVKVVSCEVRFFGKKFGIYYLPKFSIERLLKQNILVASCFFRRSDFDATIGYNPNMKYGYEDWDFWISLLKAGGEVYRIPKVCFYYRIKEKSMVSKIGQDISKRKKMLIQLYQNHQDTFDSFSINPILILDSSFCSNIKNSFIHKLLSIFKTIKYSFI